MRLHRSSLCVLVAVSLRCSAAPPQDLIGPPVEALRGAWTHVYLGDYPTNRENGWSEGLQGVAHDERHWFFTQKRRIWKFPDTIDLRAFVNQPDSTRGILRVSIPDALVRAGYDHFGDLDQHRGLLLVPMDGPSPAVIAVFRAGDLRFVGRIELPHQRNAGWNAVDSASGRLYSSESELGAGTGGVLVYALPWDQAVAGRLPAQLLPLAELRLRDEAGHVLRLTHMQGGVITGGELLTANGHCAGGTTNTGLMAFDTASGRRTAWSSNGSGDFNFEFHPALLCLGEEPQGIDSWDLETGRAPGISGQVHVIMLDKDLDDDDFYFKHYRRLRTSITTPRTSRAGTAARDWRPGRNGVASTPMRFLARAPWILALSGSLACTVSNRESAVARSEVAEAMQRYQAVARTVNPDSIAAMYTPTATLFEPGILPVRSRDSIRAFVASFPGVQAHEATATVDTIEVHDGTAYLWGTYFERLDFPGQPQSMQRGKFVAQWARQDDGRWLIHRMFRVPLPTSPPDR